MISYAYAQAVTATPANDAIMQMVPFVFIFVIMYFLIIRPQQRRVKEMKLMIDNIRRGDTIVTAGGLIGKVTKVEESELSVEINTGNIVRIVKSMVLEVRVKGEPVQAQTK